MNEQHILRQMECIFKHGDKHDFENEYTLFNNPKIAPPTITWRCICKMCGAYQIHMMDTIYPQIHTGPEGRMFEYWEKNKN